MTTFQLSSLLPPRPPSIVVPTPPFPLLWSLHLVMSPHYSPLLILALVVAPPMMLTIANAPCEVGVFTGKRGVVLRFPSFLLWFYYYDFFLSITCDIHAIYFLFCTYYSCLLYMSHDMTHWLFCSDSLCVMTHFDSYGSLWLTKAGRLILWLIYL